MLEREGDEGEDDGTYSPVNDDLFRLGERGSLNGFWAGGEEL